ncbi:unnamed protein product [Thelazia callipaeda]|uniref:IGFBP N-terminal domain-containing protein n=1 Tax=Thelazia callipaeda TaxID=103827 RepID=A0A0N5DAA4_THECL|nr:unnamed protein product [Thelazia callipaeda]
MLAEISSVCLEECPDFCPDLENLECSELARDPCDCCIVCMHQPGELCGPAIAACRYPSLCYPLPSQTSLGTCSDGMFEAV